MAVNSQISPWWAPDRFADRKPFLDKRAAITARLRAFFAENSFIEVETAVLQVSPGNETHLHAPRTEIRGAGAGAATRNEATKAATNVSRISDNNFIIRPALLLISHDSVSEGRL